MSRAEYELSVEMTQEQQKGSKLNPLEQLTQTFMGGDMYNFVLRA